MSQMELAALLGFEDDGQISRHECSRSLPTLIVALSYELIFGVPVSALFPGIRDHLKQRIEQRIAEMERELQQKKLKGSRGARLVRKLEWCWERKRPK
jgi:hypothetical protein